MKNLKVIARNEIDGLYYPGHVTEGPEYETRHVYFWDIKTQNVPSRHVIPLGGAVPWPTLFVNDFALIEVECRTTRIVYYIPGVVYLLPKGHCFDTNFYTILLYNGKYVHKSRRQIVKVTRERYELIMDYIKTIRYRRPSAFNPRANRQLVLGNQRSTDGEYVYGMKVLLGAIQASHSLLAMIHSIQNINKNTLNTRSKRRRRRLRYRREYRFKTSSPRSPSPGNHSITPPRLISPGNTPSPRPVSPGNQIITPLRRASTISSQSNERKPKVSDFGAQTGGQQTDRGAQTDAFLSSTDTSITSTSHDSEKEAVVEPVLPTHVPVRIGDRVLARWLDDGWYYFGSVVKCVRGGNQYRVEDATGHREHIDRRDFFIEPHTEVDLLQPAEPVIALHPAYVNSYAPGKVRSVFSRHRVEVVFYDGALAKLPNEEVYKIAVDKYKMDVAQIEEREEQMCGRNVQLIALDEREGTYKLCKATSRVGRKQRLAIKLPDGYCTDVEAKHIFETVDGKFSLTSNRPKRKWQYVLGPSPRDGNVYLPAEIMSRKPLRLHFCDGQESRLHDLRCCFYLSHDYYRQAVNFYFHRQQNADSTRRSS